MRTEWLKTRKAAERVQALMGFYIHAGVYIAVNAGLIILNLVNDPNDWWAQWPLLGWGCGLALHAVLALSTLPDKMTEWQLRRIWTVRQRI